MRLKPGVRIQGARPELVLGLVVAAEVYRDLGATPRERLLLVTSITDPAAGRKPNSLHPKGLAADLSVHDIPRENWPAYKVALAQELGPEWDVVLETEKQGRTPHLHIEFEGERIARPATATA